MVWSHSSDAAQVDGTHDSNLVDSRFCKLSLQCPNKVWAWNRIVKLMQDMVQSQYRGEFIFDSEPSSTTIQLHHLCIILPHCRSQGLI